MAKQPPDVSTIMGITLTDIHGHEVDVRTAAQLESLLRTTPRQGQYAAFYLQPTDREQELWVHFNEDLAYLHYFIATDGSHPGFQPDVPVDEKMEPRGSVVFLQVGGIVADGIEMPMNTVIEVDLAVAAAREFFATVSMPTCIDWFEL